MTESTAVSVKKLAFYVESYRWLSVDLDNRRGMRGDFLHAFRLSKVTL